MSANWNGMLVTIIIVTVLFMVLYFHPWLNFDFGRRNAIVCYCLGPELVNLIVIHDCSGISGKQVWAACRDSLYNGYLRFVVCLDDIPRFRRRK